jgi:hypothetical protein
VKSFKLDLAGTRLRQDIPWGNRRASGSHKDCRTDQDKTKCWLQQATKTSVSPSRCTAQIWDYQPDETEPIGVSQGPTQAATAETFGKSSMISD